MPSGSLPPFASHWTQAGAESREVRRGLPPQLRCQPIAAVSRFGTPVPDLAHSSFADALDEPVAPEHRAGDEVTSAG